MPPRCLAAAPSARSVPVGQSHRQPKARPSRAITDRTTCDSMRRSFAVALCGSVPRQSASSSDQKNNFPRENRTSRATGRGVGASAARGVEVGGFGDKGLGRRPPFGSVDRGGIGPPPGHGWRWRMLSHVTPKGQADQVALRAQQKGGCGPAAAPRIHNEGSN